MIAFPFLFALFGALGGFLSMLMFFKDRKAP
jgi:hypothetical protein